MKAARTQSENQPDQSSNTWINKGLPKDISTLAPYKDGFTDILEERRHSGDIRFMTRARHSVPQYKHCVQRTPGEIRQHVLDSDRVKYTIERLAGGNKAKEVELCKEAEAIMTEMGHELDMKSVRGFAYAIIKVFKALFKRVYVNEDGVHKLRKLMEDYPVLLMPTHRSYMDFLLVSYICYHYDLPLPAIAAAMDFKGMSFFGWLLRHSGAFYIRRSFGSDHLYWAIFTEYVQTQLRNGDNPLEFFVEGTRSRTNKSYIPKTGMLTASLEAYFKAELPDTMMVPITVSFDRILEESLYAYELLGIPKPKESTSGLLKARSILSEDFGSIHIYISEPISIRQFSAGRVDRGVHALEPRYINSLKSSEKAVITDLAFHIVRQHQRHQVISPWSIMAAILMQSRETGIAVRQLVKEVDWLKRQTQNLGAYVDWPGDVNSEDVVRFNLSLHKNVVTLFADEDMVRLGVVQPRSDVKPVTAGSDVLITAATHLVLSSYRNQLTHVFIRVAIVSIAINGCREDTMTVAELYKRYAFLEKLLSRDFVFQPGHTREDFNQAVLTLKNSGALVLTDGPGSLSDVTDIYAVVPPVSETQIIHVKKSFNKHTTFYSQMFEPFLLAYWVVCQHLLSLPMDRHGRPLPKKPKDLSKDVQKLAIRLLEENAIKHFEILSMDVISNGLSVLVDMGTMYKDRRNNESWLSPNNIAVADVAKQISAYIDLPTIAVSSFTSNQSNPVVFQAKL